MYSQQRRDGRYAIPPRAPSSTTSAYSTAAPSSSNTSSYTTSYSTAEPSSNPTSSTITTGQIVLQIGERKFTTTVETLVSESGYFKSMFAGRWPVTKQEDGSCFIDADPNLFEHILRFMRQGTFPIFLNGRTFDFSLYGALLDCARFFQVNRLEEWIENEKYSKRVITFHTVSEVSGDKLFGPPGRLSYADEEADYYPSLRTRRVYVCPHNIEAHTTPRHCGRACEEKRGKGVGPEYREEQYWSALVIEKHFSVNHTD